jgi:hypothetical protein
MTQKTIAYKNTPVRLPIWTTATAWLLLDRCHAPGWAWGAAGVIAVIVWVVSIVTMFHEERVDIFAEKRAPLMATGRRAEAGFCEGLPREGQ